MIIIKLNIFIITQKQHILMGNSNKGQGNQKENKDSKSKDNSKENKNSASASSKQIKAEVAMQEDEQFNLLAFTRTARRGLQNLDIKIGEMDIEELRMFRLGLSMYQQRQEALINTITLQISERLGVAPKLSDIATTWWTFYSLFAAALYLLIGGGLYNIITIMASNLENKHDYLVGCGVGGLIIVLIIGYGYRYRTPQSFETQSKSPKESQIAKIWRKAKNSNKKSGFKEQK